MLLAPRVHPVKVVEVVPVYVICSDPINKRPLELLKPVVLWTVIVVTELVCDPFNAVTWLSKPLLFSCLYTKPKLYDPCNTRTSPVLTNVSVQAGLIPLSSENSNLLPLNPLYY